MAQTYLAHQERVEARRPGLKYALTVLGPVREDQLDMVLAHTHILADFSVYHEPFSPIWQGARSNWRCSVDCGGTPPHVWTTCSWMTSRR
jgi:hypothetical protein